jgi:hypothetical protein
MKTLGIILLTAIIFAVIVVGALFGVLGYINEETRKRCGNCMFFDRDLRICWGNLSKKGEYIKGCDKHVRKDEG